MAAAAIVAILFGAGVAMGYRLFSSRAMAESELREQRARMDGIVASILDPLFLFHKPPAPPAWRDGGASAWGPLGMPGPYRETWWQRARMYNSPEWRARQ